MDIGMNARTDFDVTLGIQKNVVGLYVSVNDMLAVEMAETFACL